MSRHHKLRTTLVLLGAASVIALGATAVRGPSVRLAASVQSSPAASDVVRPAAKLSDAFVAISEALMPAIVRIESEYAGGPEGQRSLPPELREFFNGPGADIPRMGGGTGFIVRQDGYILTNSHVVEGAQAVRVTLFDKRRYDATVVGLDPTTDIALLKVDVDGLPVVQMGDSEALRVGEWVLAIGNPGFGNQYTLDFTVTSGIVSAKGRPLNILNHELGQDDGGPPAQYAIEDFIQTDAVINPGNSGGPLVDLRGQVVGINTAIASGTGFYQGYGFAIPINLARRVIDDLLEHGHVRRALLGVSIRDISVEDAEVYGLPAIAGVLVHDFAAGSPGQEAGLRLHDVIVAVDERPVERVGQLQRLIAQHRPGQTVAVEVIRYGESHTFEVELMEAPLSAPILPRPPLAESGEQELGIVVRDLSASLARKYRYDRTGGVVIDAVEAGSAAARASLRPGTRILSIDRQQVTDARSAQAMLDRADSGEVVSLVLAARSDNTWIVNVRIP